MVNFEISLQPGGDGLSIFDENALPTLETLGAYEIPSTRLVETKRLLQENEIEVHGNGRFTISASADEEVFERFFGTKLEEREVPADEYVSESMTVQTPRARITAPTITGLAGFETS